jgi:hypothetical protein
MESDAVMYAATDWKRSSNYEIERNEIIIISSKELPSSKFHCHVGSREIFVFYETQKVHHASTCTKPYESSPHPNIVFAQHPF